MTAGLPLRSTPAAGRISTASPILLHTTLITVFRVVLTLLGTTTVLSRPDYHVWQEWKWNQALGIHRGHPSKYWPRWLALNQPTVPMPQPPLHLNLGPSSCICNFGIVMFPTQIISNVSYVDYIFKKHYLFTAWQTRKGQLQRMLPFQNDM